MPRDFRIYLDDILNAIDKIYSYVLGIDLEKLGDHPVIIDAVLYNLQIIGEAAKHVPEEMRIIHAQVEWRKIIGLRDMIAHEYFGISLEIIKDILRNKLPALKEEITVMLAQENRNNNV